MGRPPKISETRIDILCKHIEGGASIEAACELVGITARTFHNWMNRAEEIREKPPSERSEADRLYIRFFQAATRARAKREKKLAGTVYEAATEDEDWRAAAWLLERMYPERYSKKNEARQLPQTSQPIEWADEEIEDVDYTVVQQDPDSSE